MTVLLIQTAFLGDVILTTPLLHQLAASGATVDVVVTPAGAQAMTGHISARNVIVYDKRGEARGVGAFLKLARRLRASRYELAIIPHRSLRSALLARIAGIPRLIGFDRSAGRWFLDTRVRYRPELHEIDRNLLLLEPLSLERPWNARPVLTVQTRDQETVSAFLDRHALRPGAFVAMAPGSVWFTKRWPEERYAELGRRLADSGIPVVLLGGKEDAALSRRIFDRCASDRVIDAAGLLTVLQSAALIGVAGVLVTNDSAPLHMGSAMRTPIVAIFGATSPSFGFGPRGERDVVLETNGLDCRPCAIHGGAKCPVGTFECMLRIDPAQVEEAVRSALACGR